MEGLACGGGGRGGEGEGGGGVGGRYVGIWVTILKEAGRKERRKGPKTAKHPTVKVKGES